MKMYTLYNYICREPMNLVFKTKEDAEFYRDEIALLSTDFWGIIELNVFER